jgi:transposase
MTKTSIQNTSQSVPRKYVSNSEIQKRIGISGKTVRRWAEQFDWRMMKINSRVHRFAVEDVEQTTGEKFD